MRVSDETLVFQPQAGAQTEFMRSSADIVLYGGAAGGGKTYALLLESLRHHQRKNATVAIFRRERTRFTNPGGLWAESQKIFPHFGATPNQQRLEWKFPTGSTVSMCALQYETDLNNYLGSQILVIMFDEITEFTEKQFWFMLSRNRSDTGIAGYIRATCNPDSDSWVADLIKWWIDDQGFPIPTRSGVVRWFCRINDSIHWADSKDDLVEHYKVLPIDCKSFTFIPATIEDNQILLQNDPAYISNLRALSEVEKQRFLYGNWKIKPTGKIFQQRDFLVFTRPPSMIEYQEIHVDTAQKTKEANDFTVMQLWAKADKGLYLIKQVRGKFEYPDLKMMFKAFCDAAPEAKIYVEDSVSGTALIQDCMREMKRPITAVIRHKDKYTRAYDASGYIKSGYVFLNCMSDYYTDFISEAVAFSADGSHKHDDQVDTMLSAIESMLINKTPQKSQTMSSLSTLIR